MGVASLCVAVGGITQVLSGWLGMGNIVKMGTSVIRREYTAELVRSNRVRDRRQITVLNENRAAINVFELQGPIFFGSADRLAQILEARMAVATYCILDMKQVTEIDSTGAHILVRL